MKISKLLEEIDELVSGELTEDELVDTFDMESETDDNTMEEFDLTDNLEKKVKISKALDTLIDAIDDFKNSVDMDSVGQFLGQIDDAVSGIQSYLMGEEVTAAPELTDADIEEVEDTFEDEIEDAEEDEDIEQNFNAEASLDFDDENEEDEIEEDEEDEEEEDEDEEE